MSEKGGQDAVITVVFQFFDPVEAGGEKTCLAAVSQTGMAPKLYTPPLMEALYKGVIFDIYSDYIRGVAHGNVQAAVVENKEQPAVKTKVVPLGDPVKEVADVDEDFDLYAGEEW